MAIKPSASAEVRALIVSLSNDDPTVRETAIARLAVIGARAVDRLIEHYAAAPVDARVAVLRTLEAIGDPRALPLARTALAEGGDVAVAAAGTLRPLLESPGESTAGEALDLLISAALAPDVARSVRIAAFAALRDIPVDLRDRLSTALADDPDSVVRAAGQDVGGEKAAIAEWNEAIAGRVGQDPGALVTAAATRSAETPLSELQRLIEAARARELDDVSRAQAGEWRTLRGILHEALARRSSTVALYDLRESVAASDAALPPAFARALQLIGDESCLEPVAAAYCRTTDAAWREQLRQAFATISTREKLTPRSAVARRIVSRWPDAADLLSTLSRTTPRPTRRART